MIKKISDSEISLVESMANDIQKRIHTYYMENVISKEYVKAEVLVPMSENVNMTFEIDVPYEFMDEDNTALLEYFVGHIYQPESGSYMTESINESIAKKERDLQKFQENLDNFDVDAFERGDYDSFNECDDGPCDISTTLPGDFDGDFLDTPIDGEYLTESAASRAYPVLRQRKKSGLKFTDEELVVIRKIDTEKVGVPNNPLEMVVTDKTRFLPHAIERTEEREMSPDSASVNDIIQASVIMFEQEKSDENDAYYPYLFVGSDDAVVVGVTKRCKLEVDAVITLWNYQEVSRLNKKDMKSKKDLDKVLVEVVKCIPVKKEQN